MSHSYIPSMADVLLSTLAITHIVCSVAVVDVHLSLAVAKQDCLAVRGPLDVSECHTLYLLTPDTVAIN